MRWEWGSGYRNDTLHWHLQNPDNRQLTYSEQDRDLQFWENQLTIRVIYRDIAIFARGSYGAFGGGSFKQKYSNLNFSPDPIFFFWQPKSWNLDGWGYFGYSVNLTPDRTYRVVLIPMIGFNVDYEQFHCGKRKEAFGGAILPAASYSMSSRLPGSQRMCWFGPLIGAVAMIHPGGRLRFEAGYAYHWLHLRFTTIMQSEISTYSANMDLINQSAQYDKLKVKDHSNLAHSGWGRFDYILSDAWRAGLEASIQYLSSRVLNARIKNEFINMRTVQKFKARWTAISGVLSISRTF
jgi:hypothetical protein